MKKVRAYLPLCIYAGLMLAFSLLFTRLLIKMDDGNFLGIVNAPDFTYAGWLTERYQTWAGRTVGEFLIAFFLRVPLIVWKWINPFWIVVLAYFWMRLSACFARELPQTERQIFCCAGLFLMIVSCLNPGVFWYTGSIMYLWTSAGLLLTVAPLLFYVLEGRVSKLGRIAAPFAALLATAHEQTAACAVALTALLLIVLAIKRMRFHWYFLPPAVVTLWGTLHLLLAPGQKLRAAAETAGFPTFADMDLLQKLLCGGSVYLAHTLYLSTFLFLTFLALLCAALFSARGKRLAVLIPAILLCIGVNGGILLTRRETAHMLVRAAYLNGDFNAAFWCLMLGGAALLLTAFVLCLLLWRRDGAVGLTAAVCLAGSVCTGLMMGFSPSIFASGQRAMFVGNLLLITACTVLIAWARRDRWTRAVYGAAVAYAALTFLLDCFAFRLAELPLMG